MIFLSRHSSKDKKVFFGCIRILILCLWFLCFNSNKWNCWFSLWTNFAFWCGCCLSHGNLHALLLVRKLSGNELSDLISWNCSKLVIRIYKSWLHKCILHDLAIFNMAKLNLGTSCPTSECSWQHKCILHDVSNYNLQYSTLITCIIII